MRPYYYGVEQLNPDVQIFGRFRSEMLILRLKKLTVVDALPATMRYVPGSAVPAPTSIDPPGARLTWETDYVPTDGLTITFQGQPSETGCQPLSAAAKGWFVHSGNRHGEFEFRVPWVTVLVPTR